MAGSNPARVLPEARRLLAGELEVLALALGQEDYDLAERSAASAGRMLASIARAVRRLASASSAAAS
jgi:hypothetical protein